MLPAARALKDSGAGKGAVAAFLVATPETGVDSLAVSYALLDPLTATARPVAAVLSGLVVGLLQTEEASSKRPIGPRPLSLPRRRADCGRFWVRVKDAGRYMLHEVWGGMAAWFFAGVLLAGIAAALIPPDFLAGRAGSGLGAKLAALVVGIPLYVCAQASTPIAAAFIAKGLSPGAALVFLLVGPGVNATSLAVLPKLLGGRGTLLYLGGLAATALLAGIGLDALHGHLPQPGAAQPSAAAGESFWIWSHGTAAILLAAYAAHRFLRRGR